MHLHLPNTSIIVANTSYQHRLPNSEYKEFRNIEHSIRLEEMPRDVFLDAFRGLTVLEMEGTEVLGDVLGHAKFMEKKVNYADTIFPCFSFIAGLATKINGIAPLARGIKLICFGIIYNAPLLIIDNGKLRLPGVLQRHGLSSIIFHNLVPARLKNSLYYPLLMSSLWFAISVFYADHTKDPFGDPGSTAQQKIDSKIFGSRTYEPNFDPEGLLGSLMTSVTLWTGYYIGNNRFSDKALILSGLLQFAMGKCLSLFSPRFMPLSKPLWTPSFVLITNSISIFKGMLLKKCLAYAPAVVVNSLAAVGRQSLEVYFIGEITLLLLKFNNGAGTSIWNIAEHLLTKYMPKNLANTALLVLFDIFLVGSAFACSKWNLRLRL